MMRSFTKISEDDDVKLVDSDECISTYFPELGNEFMDLENVYQKNIELEPASEVVSEFIEKEEVVTYSEDDYKEAYESGYKDAIEVMNQVVNEKELEYKNVQKEMNSLKNNIDNTIKSFNEDKRNYVKSIDSDIRKLIISSCERIIKKKLEDDEVVLNIINEMLRSFNEKIDVTIRTHPSLSHVISNNQDDIVNSYDKLSIIFMEDYTLEENGCIIETNESRYDLQISTQLNKLYELLGELA